MIKKFDCKFPETENGKIPGTEDSKKRIKRTKAAATESKKTNLATRKTKPKTTKIIKKTKAAPSKKNTSTKEKRRR